MPRGLSSLWDKAGDLHRYEGSTDDLVTRKRNEWISTALWSKVLPLVSELIINTHSRGLWQAAPYLLDHSTATSYSKWNEHIHWSRRLQRTMHDFNQWHYMIRNVKNNYNYSVIRLAIIKLNSVALIRERTIPTERPPPVGEVSANFCGIYGCHVVSATDPHGRLISLFWTGAATFYSSSSSIDLTKLSGPRSRPTTTQKIW